MDATMRLQNAAHAKQQASMVRAQNAEVLHGLDPTADAPAVYRITLTSRRDFSGPSERVHFQDGVAYTTDTASCERFRGPGSLIEVVDPGTPAEPGAGQPADGMVTATTTEPIEPPAADATGATQAAGTAAESPGEANAPQTAAVATGEVAAHEGETARLRELGAVVAAPASHIGTLGEARSRRRGQ
jgi:hypothetical protein